MDSGLLILLYELAKQCSYQNGMITEIIPLSYLRVIASRQVPADSVATPI